MRVLLIVMLLSSCANLENYFQEPSYKAVAINPFSHILSNDSWSSTRWNIKTNAVGYRYYSHSTLAARRGALDKCYASGQPYCVLSYVNNVYVAESEVATFTRNNQRLVQQTIYNYQLEQRQRSQAISSALGAAGRDLIELSKGSNIGKPIEPVRYALIRWSWSDDNDAKICEYEGFNTLIINDVFGKCPAFYTK